MSAKLFKLGFLGAMGLIGAVGAFESMANLNLVSAAEVGAQAFPFTTGVRFNCAFQGPAPFVCTAFGEFIPAPGNVNANDNLTILCTNSVIYSEGAFLTFPTNNTAEIRSIVPGAAEITIRALNPDAFNGPLPSILRVPASPNGAITGVCHLNPLLTPVPVITGPVGPGGGPGSILPPGAAAAGGPSAGAAAGPGSSLDAEDAESLN